MLRGCRRALKLSRFVESESQLVNVVASRLKDAGFEVYKNIVVNGIEIDVLALEYTGSAVFVYVIEVKRRPRTKVYKQLARRAQIADYLFIAIPYMFYAWALKKIDMSIGIMLIMGSDIVVLRNPKYLGNGKRLIECICNERIDISPITPFCREGLRPPPLR